MQNKTENLAYEAPKLCVHGSLEDLTQGFSKGSYIDAAFPAGTAVVDMTFS